MNTRLKYLFFVTLLVISSATSLFAQPQGGGGGGRPQGGGGDMPPQRGGAVREERVEEIFDNGIDGDAQRDSIKRLYATATYEVADPSKMYRITGVNVHGVEMMDPTLLISSVGINIGDSITVPSSYISTIMERLWSQSRYSDIEVGAIITGDDIALDFIFKERPRVSEWNIEGINKKGQKKDIVEKMKFRRNSEMSDYVIDKRVKAIKRHFSDLGYLNTEVNVRIENDPIMDNMVKVTFVVDTKNRTRVGEIVFEDNEAFEDKRLRSTFKGTHQKSWNIFQSRKFNESKYEEDKDLLIDFYNSKGYRNATILSDSMYVIDDKSVGISVKVAEGHKYYIRNIEWIGNSKYNTDMLQRMFGVRSGDTYDKKTMYKRLGIGSEMNPEEMSVSSLYQNEGYLMSQIDLAEVIIGTDSIDLEVKVFEGKPYTINEVYISGNVRVDDEAIRREIYTRPGELYNRSLLMQTMRTLSNLGHFNPEAIMPDIMPVTNSLVDIGWALEEQASDQFNISGGWGGNAFVGSIGVTLNNLSTANFFEKGAWRPYPMGQNQSLTVQAQSSGTYYNAFSMTFIDPWLGGRKPNSLRVSTYYSDQASSDSYYYDSSGNYYYGDTDEHFRTFGVSAGLGRRLSWPDSNFTLYNELTYERYMLSNWSYFLMENGHANMMSLTTSFGRSTIDQQIYPRSGSNLNLSLQITPPYSAFDGKDYSDSDMSDQERYKFIEFHKWTFSGEWYQNFTKNSKLVLMLKAQMGFVGSYNSDKVSPFQRFEVGGDGLSGYSYYGVTVVSLRGYEDGALDPESGNYSLGYNKATAELRYPIILDPSTQIYVLAFLEAGSGYDSWKSFSPYNMKRSAGVGVRFYLPIVGLMGVDWGYGFDVPPGATAKSGGQFHFVLGQQF